MKLDATDLRYISAEEFRVLTAVEMGSKNHEVVPNSLIAQIAKLRHGGVNKLLGMLAKRNLVAKVQNSKYDGYRLTYGGYDFLAMRTLSKRDSMFSVGNQIGVGKESDIYAVADAEGNQMVLKIHRLGRVSFRAIKEKRDYMGKRKSASWMYMSRLAAQKEWAFMKVLHEHGFPVPKPVDQARHCIVMELIDAFPLRQIDEVPSPGKLYSELMDVIVRFAQAGLIHGDFNEFNILIRQSTGEPVVIDFPQMVSTSHENAEWYFNRDVECIRTFFRRRFRYESVLYPRFKTVMKDGEKEDGFQLDVVVAASGFGRKEMKTLEEYMEAVGGADGPKNTEDDDDDNEEEEEEEEVDEDEVEGEVEEGDEAKGQDPSQRKSNQEKVESNTVDRGSPLNMDHTDTEDHSSSDSIEISDSEQADISIRNQTRRSRSPSPSESLTAHIASLNLASPPRESVKERVTSDINHQTKQSSKYHSKRSTRRVGRPKGSKAKQDTRVKIDRSGVWE